MFTWNAFTPSRPHHQYAEGDFGQWNVAFREDEHITKASYQLPIPEGETFMSMLDKTKDRTDYASPEYRRLRAHVSAQDEIFYGPSLDLTKEFIFRLYGEAPTSRPADILKAAGLKSRDGKHWTIKVARGHLCVHLDKESIHVTFEEKGASRWWNLLRVDGFLTTYKGERWEQFFPRPLDQVLAIAVQFTVDRLVGFANEASFLPVRPKVKKGQKLPDLMAMNEAVEARLKEMGKYESRDYANHFGFNFKAFGVDNGIPADRVDEWYRTKPADMTEEERRISEEGHEAMKAWQAEHPYRDFWHFFLDVFPDLENDQNLEVEFQRLIDEAEEDWQREIAQVYVDLFGGHRQVVRVSW